MDTEVHLKDAQRTKVPEPGARKFRGDGRRELARHFFPRSSMWFSTSIWPLNANTAATASATSARARVHGADILLTPICRQNSQVAWRPGDSWASRFARVPKIHNARRAVVTGVACRSRRASRRQRKHQHAAETRLAAGKKSIANLPN